MNEEKVYIASKITGEENYREKFAAKEKELQDMGYVVMNPAVLPFPGFEHHEYMHICKAMIDVCGVVLLFDNWRDSPGVKMEIEYAIDKCKGLWCDEWSTHLIKQILEGGGDAGSKPKGLLG